MNKRIIPGGKYCKFSRNRLESTGFCDYTGNIRWKRDLVKQMDWRGNGLVWTGFLVGKDEVDIPNEQSRPQKIINPPDPQPVPDARPNVAHPLTFSTWNIPINEITNMTFCEATGSYNSIPAPTNDIRKQQLENFNWSTGGGSF